MSSAITSTREGVENSCKDRQLTDMSPVTDLAFNLKSLNTVSTGTPTRRISWSDPFKNNGAMLHMDELWPSNDSPMSFDAPMKQQRQLKKTVSRKLLSLNIEQDKENVPPKDNVLRKISSSENDEVNGSQDSGYSSSSSKKHVSFARAPNPRLRARSSLFTNVAGEEVDCTFPMDEDSDMECETDSTVIGLLTKPLCNEPENSVKKEKSPTRRCLAIDMETSCDSSNMMFNLTQNESLVPQENITSTDLEPMQKLPIKRPDPSTIFEYQSKRRRSSPSIDSDRLGFVKQRSFSETSATIMRAVQKADLQPDLIGDCSRCYALPLVKGRHQDLKCISPETLVDVLRGEYSEKIDSYTLIDCRYPYEFQGGHIQGAVNIYTKEEIIETFLREAPEALNKNVIIFHCEFSSERAPNLCRFLRNKDREVNECSYPKLHHPEIYLLDGGYKAFFQNFREYCEPQEYKPMNHKDHGKELRLFRSKSKSWGSDSKARFKVKSTSENVDI